MVEATTDGIDQLCDFDDFEIIKAQMMSWCRAEISIGWVVGAGLDFGKTVPHSFRTDLDGGGAMADIGSHIISMARYLLITLSSIPT